MAYFICLVFTPHTRIGLQAVRTYSLRWDMNHQSQVRVFYFYRIKYYLCLRLFLYYFFLCNFESTISVSLLCFPGSYYYYYFYYYY